MDTLVKKARDFAEKAHADQKYGMGPYLRHLEDVAAIAAHHGPEAMAISFLHDVLEDVKGCSIEQLEEQFGHKIAKCVAICTDEPGETRMERKQRTNLKMAAVSGEWEVALVVKAADRLANVRESARSALLDPGNKHLPRYRTEHPEFRKAAHRPGLCDAIWEELDRLLA
ncbi:MAG: HD domain-containing protein [Planctomycetota bacterium]